GIPGLSTPVFIPLSYDKANNKILAPGTQINLRIASSDYLNAKAAIEKGTSLSTITNAKIMIRYARFDNGSGWYKGAEILQTLKQSPTDLSKLAVIGEFPKSKNVFVITPPPGDEFKEPAKVTDVNYMDTDEWLKDITIEVQNVSDRTYDYLECDLIL